MPELRRGGLRDRLAVRRGAAALLAALLAAAPAAAQHNTSLPRFESLRSGRVNLRVGPGENYPIAWVLTRKEMPVEVLKEFEHWRMIRDWQGTEGWVHERMVTGRRRVVVTGAVRALRQQPDASAPPVARAEPGVVAQLLECRGAWCRVEAGDVRGWLERGDVWGVFPDEKIE